MKFKKFLSLRNIFILLEFILLVFFLFLRYKLGLVRYFDADEFAHLHWGYSFSIGEKPFADFFYLFPPFFLYPIASLFLLFGRTITAVLAARVFIFLTFAATSFVLILIGRKVRNLHVGILSALIFSFLPLPADKMIEVRPDLVATFFALLALFLFMIAGGRGKKIYFFLSGLLFAVSLGFSPKMIFFLFPVFVVSVYRIFSGFKNGSGRENLEKQVMPFSTGFAIPIMVILVLISSFGNPSRSLYSMTKMAKDVTASLGAQFYMRPDIFFYPNETYYGINGYSLPYIVNLLIYVTASLWAIFRILASLSYSDNRKCLREFLIGTTFFANLYAFVNVYPLKHAQYLIPLAPFIALYFADFLTSVFVREYKKLRLFTYLAPVFFIILLVAMTGVGKDVYARKMKWTNTQSLDKLTRYLSILPPRTPIFDLTGESIFFPNGYYFCCLPYGQYEGAILFRIPDLEKELEKRGAKYIHINWNERLNVLPALQQKYIREHFAASELDPGLLVRKEK